ncbi:hypothetical protein REPUB_Repub03eG0216600 [Reevesia pubescens]
MVSHVQHAYQPHHLLMLYLEEPRWCMVCRHVCTHMQCGCPFGMCFWAIEEGLMDSVGNS